MSRIIIKITKRNIDLLNKLMEGYDNLGIVSTKNPTQGEVHIHVTPDTKDTVLTILKTLPFESEILEDT